MCSVQPRGLAGGNMHVSGAEGGGIAGSIVVDEAKIVEWVLESERR